MRVLINLDNKNEALKRYNTKQLTSQLIKRGHTFTIVRGIDQRLPKLEDYDVIISRTGTFMLSYVAKMNEVAHKCFNKASVILTCRDKWRSYTTLKDVVKQPLTSMKQEDIGFPCVVKYRTGSFGKQVDLVNNQEELDTLIKEKYKGKNTNLIYQEVIPNDRTSVRLIYIGNEYIGACKFTAKEDNFQSNLGSGGSAEKYTPTQEMLDMCSLAQARLGTDYVGFDLLINSETDEIVFLEANSCAWTSGFDRVQGINTTTLFLDYIEDQLNKRNGE